MRRLILFLFLCSPFVIWAQEDGHAFSTKTLAVRDSMQLDSVSINPDGFRVSNLRGKIISPKNYRVDFSKSLLFPGDSLRVSSDSLQIRYRHYPDFLTRKYFQFNPNRIVNNPQSRKGLYQLGRNQKETDFKPFQGLNTTGSISRGITAGTNQNSVLDSKLDLQITGKISDNVNLRASIQDSDIPIQQSGYSQNLDEFDQVFIELYGKNWKVRGGDVDLVQEGSYFGNFHKKVQGISLGGTLNPDGNPTDVFAAGALVRGVFTRNKFDGQEGNQGPYKLTGPNGELFALIVSGSETVYVNGIRLERGENEDYTIDYNAGELMFNSTFPITSEMRITVEFQYSDRNYSRVVATGGAEHHSENWDLGGFVYSESDLRNQPLQQDLSAEQKQVLADAGDDQSQMVAPSAIPDEFSENKVLYKKDTVNGQQVFVYSNNPDDDLFRVKFSLVGENQGNYILSNSSAISKIYEYVPPVSGVPQGNYAPVTQLFAPTKLQIAVVNGTFHPSEKTNVHFELAGSKNDQNLFSDLDDADNDGFAGRLDAKQNLYTSADTTKINAFAKVNIIQKDYQSVEPLYNVEFNRDWNLEMPEGNQSFVNAGLEYTQSEHGFARYSFQKLDYSENFSGARQVLQSQLRFGDLTTSLNGSFLTSNGETFSSKFFRAHAQAVYSFDPFWVGGRFDAENNQQRANATDSLTGISQKFSSYEAFTGVGDSTNVYAEIGYRHRINDSLRQSELQRVSASDNYYLKSQLINSENAKLSVFVNYRNLKSKEADKENEKSLNSRVLYHQFLFDKIVSANTTYETNSGTVPQQEFTYVEVDPGQGKYTWNDYNNNGVQDLNEFEISPYPDQAKYVRVLLPNQVFVKTRQNKFSQILTLNFQRLAQSEDSKSFLSHFYNQTSYLVDRKVRRKGDNFNLNPFDKSNGEELAVKLNFRNSIFFNRGKQHYTTSYSFISSKTKNLLSTGLQENDLKSHQVNFNHKFGKSWLVTLKTQLNRTKSSSENFENRNYKINGVLTNPKLSYLLNQSTRFDVFYQYNQQQNQLGAEEQLNQQKLGVSFNFANAQKYSVTGEFNYIYNSFSGNPFSPVAYEMLQGLQPAKNFTWRLLFQKKLTDYLDLNLSYFGRKSENSVAIHTGSVQLKAYF